jgi:undecaprenyl diphosphate synthase
MTWKERINLQRLPAHIAIIMDGNGRWARKHGKERIFGHQHAVKSVRDTAEGCAELGVKFLTLYAFSTENWNRPKKEVDALMELLVSSIHSELKTLLDNNIRLLTIGDLKKLPESCIDELTEAIDKTKQCNGLNLVVALSYGSRWEITEAVKKIAYKVQKGSLAWKDITEETVRENLSTKDFPDPELLIRTSGEHRISNYLLWQIAYAELYFTNTLWPDFRKEDLYKAIYDFQRRERRFGKTSEQVKIMR